MSTAVIEMELKDVVEKVVMGFISRKEEFSAYSVTSAVRLMVNNGEYLITDADTTVIRGVQTQMLYHNDIKSLVYAIDMTQFNYVVESNGTYNVFKPNPIPTPTSFASDTSSIAGEDEDTDEDPCGGCTLRLTCTDSTANKTQDECDCEDCQDSDNEYSDEIKEKIDIYIYNKHCNNEEVTIRMIQSRMKGYDLTVDEIEDIIFNLDYNLDYSERGLSYAAVVN